MDEDDEMMPGEKHKGSYEHDHSQSDSEDENPSALLAGLIVILLS